LFTEGQARHFLRKSNIYDLQNFLVDADPKSMALICVSIPKQGRIAIATNAGWNAMDADVSHGVRH
jgi:hypothetical protein